MVREGNGSSQYNYGFVYYMSASNSTDAGSVNMELAGSGVEHGCKRVSTLGYWNEPDNWDTGVVPTSTDEVGLARNIASSRRMCHTRCLSVWS